MGDIGNQCDSTLPRVRFGRNAGDHLVGQAVYLCSACLSWYFFNWRPT
jgi:hypothetical protein